MLKGQKVYVASNDKRMNGYEATVKSIGSKYITTVSQYGRIQKFDKETMCDIEWSNWELHESIDNYKHYEDYKEKKRYITCRISVLLRLISDDEIDKLYSILKKDEDEHKR